MVIAMGVLLLKNQGTFGIDLVIDINLDTEATLGQVRSYRENHGYCYGCTIVILW